MTDQPISQTDYMFADDVLEYLGELDHVLKGRRKTVREHVRADVEAHILEALSAKPDSDPCSRAEILSGLGDPASYALAWADAIEVANPESRVVRLGRMIGEGGWALSRRILAGLCFALGLIFGLAIVGRLVSPETVGLFVLSDGTWLVGSWTSGSVPIARDVLGAATLPLCVVLLAVFVGLAWRIQSKRTHR